MKKIEVLLFFCVFLFSAGDVGSAERVTVVTSIYPLMDMVKQVGGDRVDVSFMVPPGASPHTFEPKPSDMIRIGNARMFVLIGAGLEFWAEKAIKSAGKKDLKVLTLSEGMPLIRGEHHHHEEGKSGGHEEEAADPHVWLDPLLAKVMVDKIAAAIIELDPAGRSYYRQRADRFKGELDILHTTIEKSVKSFRIKEYVTFHSAWNYFSRRYGLRVIGVIEESPGKEASPKHIARLVNEIRKAGARIIFAEPQFNPKAAEVIAREADAKVLFLDPTGGPGFKGRDSYIGLMRYNLSVFEEAMK